MSGLHVQKQWLAKLKHVRDFSEKDARMEANGSRVPPSMHCSFLSSTSSTLCVNPNWVSSETWALRGHPAPMLSLMTLFAHARQGPRQTDERSETAVAGEEL